MPDSALPPEDSHDSPSQEDMNSSDEPLTKPTSTTATKVDPEDSQATLAEQPSSQALDPSQAGQSSTDGEDEVDQLNEDEGDEASEFALPLDAPPPSSSPEPYNPLDDEE